MSRCPHVVVRAAAVGGRVPGFWSRHAGEHVCGVGFVRRGLDLRRSDRERHGLLGFEDLDTAVSQACVTSDGGVHVRIFFVY